MPLHIREVTKENWRAIAELSVADEQSAFIESNAYSLAETQFERGWVSVGLYDDELLIGYAMYGWYSRSDESVWLDRFMIDHYYQGQGYAKRFLELLLQCMKEQYSCKKVYLSLHPNNKAALTLYKSFGFYLNGEIDEAGLVNGLVMECYM